MRDALLGSIIGLMLGSVLVAEVDNKPAGNIVIDQLKTIPQELGEIWGYPVSHPKETALFGVGMLGLIATDVETTRFVQDHIEPRFESKLPEPNMLPHLSGTDEYLILGLAGLYSTSLVIGNTQGQQAAIGAVKAMVHTYLYSHLGLKGIFGRQRPARSLSSASDPKGPRTKNPWDFGNGHPIYIHPEVYGTAFPSFHVGLFFSVGKVFERVYDNAWLGYGIAALGLLPHFRGHNHWVSDMVGGALIGQMIGDAVVNQMSGTQTIHSETVSTWRPYISNGEVGMSWNRTFLL